MLFRSEGGEALVGQQVLVGEVVLVGHRQLAARDLPAMCADAAKNGGETDVDPWRDAVAGLERARDERGAEHLAARITDTQRDQYRAHRRDTVRAGFEHFHDERTTDRGVSSKLRRALILVDGTKTVADPVRMPLACTNFRTDG